MTRKCPKGLQNLATRSSHIKETDSPHRTFLRVANLELRKSLCTRVREAAVRRVAEMDEQLADIDGQQAQLLQAIRGHASPASPPVSGPSFLATAGTSSRGFTIKY
jgi:hypothetical protein